MALKIIAAFIGYLLLGQVLLSRSLREMLVVSSVLKRVRARHSANITDTRKSQGQDWHPSGLLQNLAQLPTS